MPRAVRFGWSLRVLALVAAVMLLGAACSDQSGDLERVREANEAARAASDAAASPTATAKVVEDVDIFELRPGDCVLTDFEAAGAREIVEFDFASCDGDWSYIVLNDVLVPSASEFPGDAYFAAFASVECDVNTTFQLVPTEASWRAGDRLIACLAARDTIGAGRAGACYLRTLDEELSPASEVACSGPHLIEVYFATEFPSVPEYVGDDALAAFADATCLEEFSRYVGIDYLASELFYGFFTPTEPTWEYVHDRTVVCWLFADGFEFRSASARDSRL